MKIVFYLKMKNKHALDSGDRLIENHAPTKILYDVLKMLTDDATFITIRNNANLKIKIESHVLQIVRPL